MKEAPKISVVIPCFNHGEFLAEAVASVVARGGPDTELIVVDDGSTDPRTVSETTKWATQGIRVIRQCNKGPAAARNAGISVAKAEYIFPLDADDRLRIGWISRASQLLDSNPKFGVIYGDAQCFGSRTDRWQTGPFDPYGILIQNLIHASALYRRSVWETNGGYDETPLLRGIEDWDFWLSTLEHGWQFEYLPEVFFEYRFHEGTSMRMDAGERMRQINEFIARKHSLLYRDSYLRLAGEASSIRATSRNLFRLIRRNLRHTFSNGNSK